MDYTSRLADLTLEQANLQYRQAAMLTLLVKDIFGSYAREEPTALDGFLASRNVSQPVQLLVKAAVSAGNTTDGTWAGPIAPSRPMLAAHLGAADRQAVLPRLGAVRVPTTNAVGAAQTAGATGYWVGESGPKPLSPLGFAALSLTPDKIAADLAATAELLRIANARILELIEKASVKAVTETWDTALLDPANAGIAGVKPASLTNGLVAITPAGDFQNQVGQVLAAISGGAPTKPALVVSLQNALRSSALPNISKYVQVIVSPAAGNRLIAIDADGVAYVDDGGELKIGEPDIEMSDTPATTATSAVVLVSSFQRDMKVIRSERLSIGPSVPMRSRT